MTLNSDLVSLEYFSLKVRVWLLYPFSRNASCISGTWII